MSKTSLPSDFPYADILHTPRPVAKSPMSIDARAAQFAPYAALSGHQDAVYNNELAAEHAKDHDIINMDDII